MSGAAAYTWGESTGGAGHDGGGARASARDGTDEGDEHEGDVQPKNWEEVQAKAAVELTVMAKACASKGRAEVAESTAKAIDALRGHVEVRSTSPDTINGTKQGTCSVTIVREARALARLAEPLIVLEPELANTPGMYVVLAQGCMFPHELIHQLAAASEYYAEKCALENSPGLPPLLFAYKKDTVRLQRQGIERGAAVIAFSYRFRRQ
jgi:hypothetical protein